MTNLLTRRRTIVGLGAIGATALLPRPTRADLAELAAAARKEATLTWYIAQVDAEQAEMLGRIFTHLETAHRTQAGE